MIEGLDVADPKVRQLDQSRIGAVLCGEAEALHGGPPVTAMLIQNTNPMSVAPDQAKVKRGFAREDLFVCVHEQVMTETAAMADIVLPATMFLEHDDIYKGGGHQYILFGPKLIEPPGECRTNHQVFAGLADAARPRPSRLRDERARAYRLDAPAFRPRHASRSSRRSAGSTASPISSARITSTASPIRTGSSASSRTGRASRRRTTAPMGPWQTLPALPDYWPAIEEADATPSVPPRRPRRRARSSTRPSTRRRPRAPRKAAARKC